jgi:hypothetical protein
MDLLEKGLDWIELCSKGPDLDWPMLMCADHN